MVSLTWENAYGTEYKIQTSLDNVAWTDVAHVTNGKGNKEVLKFDATLARYVRMFGIHRATTYGFSLWDFGVYPPVSIGLNKPATASSLDNPALMASLAVDSLATTRWSSNRTDNQWIAVDLGTQKLISSVQLNWETAYGKEYKIQVSNDNVGWTDVATVTNGDGEIDFLRFPVVNARYVRMYGIHRGTNYGFSLWDFAIYSPVSMALNQATTASSYNAPYEPRFATDSDLTTRWGSSYADNQWLCVDLEAPRSISGVELNWEAAFAKTYKIQTSLDGTAWTDIASVTNGAGGDEVVLFSPVNARYVRMNGLLRGTSYGFSLWDFSVYQ